MTTSEAATQQRLVAGRYRLHTPLGRGGMGVVWAAEDELLQRPVAVKEVRFPPTVDDEERELLRERTLREARTAARLDHPCAVRVFDVCDDDEQPFIVMERLVGRTLSDIVKHDGPVTPARAAEIGLCLLDALSAAHAAGIVHRDVKPGNVVVGEDGRVTLTDFGIASTAGDPSITSTGLLLGSPAYIAPERARGGRPEPASDLWSLGATLYTAVEGRPPFDKPEAVATLAAVVTEPHEPCRRASGLLCDAIHGLLDKDPEARPNVDELRSALQTVAADPDAQVAAPASAAPVSPHTGGHTVALSPTEVRPPVTARQHVLAMAALSAVVFVVTAFISAMLTSR
ncbi:MAG TPA: serine/threonine-protein kinase [Mycobacteriales bacterium]|nr:serine/threonine-protein kinase [Mycobacteriales bacterium]